MPGMALVIFPKADYKLRAFPALTLFGFSRLMQSR